MEKVQAIWALDPHESNIRPSPTALEEARMLFGGSFETVRPVYVHADTKIHDCRPLEEVQNYLREMQIGKTANIEIVDFPEGRRKDWVQKICEMAESQNVSVVILSSHGRSSLGGMLFGSFCYDLLQIASFPVLILAPHRTPPASRKVMFATDLSEDSFGAFQSFLEFVSGKADEVVLFHTVTIPTLGMVSLGLPGTLPESFARDEVDSSGTNIKKWEEMAQKICPRAMIKKHVVENFLHPSEAITKLAIAQEIGTIGVASHGGPKSNPLLGSTVRDLIFMKQFNVWSCGPQFVRSDEVGPK